LLSFIDYFFFIYPYKFLAKAIGFEFLNRVTPERVRLYARFPFRVSWADWFDRLSAPIRFYYNEEDLRQWAKNANLKNVVISPTGLYGWRLYGEKD
jgi:hypothetical protein